MRVNLDQRLIFPPETATTTLRPDLVFWSNSCLLAYIIELTVPWEDAIEEAYERKKLRYSNLAAEAEDRGWKIRVRPVEVGCRGFVASTTAKLLREESGDRLTDKPSKSWPTPPRGRAIGCG